MTEVLSSTPSDALRERLDDPQTAASLALLLEKADTLAMAVVMLDEFLRRGDEIMGNVTGSLKDVKAIGEAYSYLGRPTRRLTEEAPRIADAAEALLDSGMLSREVVTLLGDLAGALTEGAAAAKANGTSIGGILPAIRALRDPDVARGLGFIIEISRALGKSL